MFVQHQFEDLTQIPCERRAKWIRKNGVLERFYACIYEQFCDLLVCYPVILLLWTSVFELQRRVREVNRGTSTFH